MPIRESPSFRGAPVSLIQPLLALPARWGVPEDFIMSSDYYQVQGGYTEAMRSLLIRNLISFCIFLFIMYVLLKMEQNRRQNGKSLT